MSTFQAHTIKLMGAAFSARPLLLRVLLGASLVVLGLALFQDDAAAQSGQKPAQAPKAQVQKPSPPKAPKDVSGPEMSMLIRGTIVALHQANVTGNYTVLRDLGASSLRQTNSPADLAVLFAEFRERRFNLAPAVLFDAVLDQKPKLTPNGLLQVIGHFPTKPQEVLFDMTFLYEAGAWRLALLRVGSRMAVASNDPQPKPAANKPAPKPAAKPAPAAAQP